MVRKLLLFCGLFSSLFYVAINIIVPMYYPGYSIVSQVVSELSAVGAPTRSLWVLLAYFYSLLVIAFGWGTWLSSRENRPLRWLAILLVVYGASGFFWPPMHQREALAAGESSMTDTLHIVFSAATAGMMLLGMGLGAAAFGKRFRYYSIASIVLLLIFGALTGMDAPRMEANLSTPLIGAWERICIAVYMVWVMVLSVLLLQREKKTAFPNNDTGTRFQETATARQQQVGNNLPVRSS